MGVPEAASKTSTAAKAPGRLHVRCQGGQPVSRRVNDEDGDTGSGRTMEAVLRRSAEQGSHDESQPQHPRQLPGFASWGGTKAELTRKRASNAQHLLDMASSMVIIGRSWEL